MRADRRARLTIVLGVTIALAAAAAPAAAQQVEAKEREAARPASTAGPGARTDEPKPIVDPKLIFEREVFVYPADTRRDPFEPPGKDGLGPRFDDLSLRMIIYAEAPGGSMAVLADRSEKSHRLRRGQTLGNATVVEITPSRAVFIVEDYGNRRREVLDLRPDTGPEAPDG